MSFNYAKAVEPKAHTQFQQVSPKQIKNSEGAFTFQVNKWDRLQRFLILGTEAGSYYACPQTLTLENAKHVLSLIAEDGLRVVKEVVDISEAGRAIKNDPALFVLALAAKKGDDATRRAAMDALPRVARIGTHLFTFAESIKTLGGWGRATKRGFANWFLSKREDDLVYQAIKYQQRDGWSQRDLLRKAHPNPRTERQKAIFHWITQGWEGVGNEPHSDEVLARIWAFERAKDPSITKKTLVKLITDYRLPHECVPNDSKNDPEIWEAMLQSMGTTAIIRNLAKMTSIGLLKPMSDPLKLITTRLRDENKLKKERVHPYQILLASKIYAQGHGDLGKLSWSPLPKIVDALDDAFYLAFSAVEPTGKRFLLGLDVSPSMGGAFIQSYRRGKGGRFEGYNTPITARVGAAVMSMATAKVEEEHYFYAFNHQFVRMPISAKQRLDDVIHTTERFANSWGGTDCALPMIHALKERIPVDVFCVYTDSETHDRSEHPHVALERYRQKMGIPAKLVVIGMVANNFTIANPDDGGMLDVVGFDTNCPALISNFARGSESGSSDSDEDDEQE